MLLRLLLPMVGCFVLGFYMGLIFAVSGIASCGCSSLIHRKQGFRGKCGCLSLMAGCFHPLCFVIGRGSVPQMENIPMAKDQNEETVTPLRKSRGSLRHYAIIFWPVSFARIAPVGLSLYLVWSVLAWIDEKLAVFFQFVWPMIKIYLVWVWLLLSDFYCCRDFYPNIGRMLL